MSFINKLALVKAQQEHDDIYTFYFTTPKRLKRKAGQHGLFVLPGLYRPHPFTISSSPEEEFITISTHVDTGSRYKKRLTNMKKGDSMIFFGPLLWFTFRKNIDKYVFLAQGIGITPFRSMLVHANHKSLPFKTTLIHVDSKTHTFKKLTEQYATNAYYPANPDEFREYVEKQDTNQTFYLSGSPRFVKATIELLLKLGVEKRNIKTDSFLGY